ncbi:MULTISPECIES: type II/IV secretion system ATPase subunit [Methanoculleus]|uniref:Type II secretion system protein E n=2 Tax=Methanoculleus TaxID=45989 RepID=A3CU32_METMJ|nr:MULTISPECIES: type II/IV secretion system ATPase subunit [Methanoculleus]ABN56882.1 type II secretion system protein E [Methanoculleus marisnigri JR1]MCC7556739.1 type II/IV secretion system ATPase subunit [Methanoculleus marisnigri]UYU18311.1 type II/IV secretion system ATPase subunit [Methanoculleus submarinus]
MGSALEATVTLPFEPEFIDEGNDCYNNVESCALYRMLPANARDYVKASPHLLEYLHILPVNTVGIPLFLSELKRDLKSMENPNIIYPVNETTFIHIFPDPNDVRNWYIPIEPAFLHSVKEILPVIEEKLIDMIDALEEEPVTEKARIGVLKNFIQQLVYIKKPGEVIDKSLLAGGKSKDLKLRIKTFLTSEIGAPKRPQVSGRQELADGRIILTQQEYKALEYMIIRDKIEMGTLKPFLSDRYIEDITCDGVGPIFIEHKIFKGLKSVIGFRDSQELDNFVVKLAERIKRPLTYRNPIVDSTLPDGSRINIVYGTEISKHGSNFTIRKVNEVPLSILQVIESGACDYMMAAYLWICLEYGMSMFVSGETASGKTTTLNALTTFLPPENKIVTIEDTPELTVPHRNWTREVAKAKGKGEGEGSEVTMFDLLKAALRQRPNQILVGEIRGVEGSVAFSAMQTGHPVMSTFHAASVEKLIQRLCGDPINIPKTYVDNLNLVIIQSAVKLPQGGTVRRMLSVNELVGYDPETQGFSFMAAFVWDPATDSFTFTGKGSSYLLENKIATMLGIPENRRAEIYDEVDKRAKILERLHKAGYTQFWDLFHMTTKIKKQGLLNIEV